SSRASAAAASPSSAVARIAGSSGASGRNNALTWSRLIADTTSASRAHSVTARPARCAVSAKAVPHAPPPTMPMRSMAAPLSMRVPSPHPIKMARRLAAASGARQRARLLHRVGAGLAGDAVLRAGATAAADGANELAALDQWDAAFRRHDAGEEGDIDMALLDRFEERLGRAAERRRRVRLVLRDLDRGDLRV